MPPPGFSRVKRQARDPKYSASITSNSYIPVKVFLPDGQYSLVPGEISKGVQFKASGRGEELQKILARKTIVGCTLVRVGGGC